MSLQIKDEMSFWKSMQVGGHHFWLAGKALFSLVAMLPALVLAFYRTHRVARQLERIKEGHKAERLDRLRNPCKYPTE